MIIKDKLQYIYDTINVLLSRFKIINVKKLNEIPIQIEQAVLGVNKISAFMGKTIQEITANDLTNVTTIGNYTFSDYINLTSVTIGDSVTSIGIYAFYGCTSLTSVTIPNSVIDIGFAAFRYCTSLTSITIPKSVTSIDNYAFRDCNNLTNIYLNPIVPPTLDDTSAIPTTTTIHVPVGSGDAYKAATNWSYHSSRIVEDIQPS